MRKFTYDLNHRIDVPTFVLSNVYHHQIGVINNIDIDNIQVNFNMNSQQEVSFDVYKELNGEKCSVWDKLQSLKYIFIPEHEEYYKADISIDDSDRTIKHVVMSSASEYELSNKIIRSLEINTDVDILRADRDETGQTPAYQPNILYNPNDTDNSILHRILADKAPDWSIAHVDESIASIQRTFSISNQKIYDCLTQTIAKEYDCLFQFDSVNRTISAYDLLNQCEDCGKRGEFLTECPECGSHNIHKGYGKDTNIFITYNNFSEKITLDGDEGAVKNCFSVQGGDDTITSRVRLYNPNGSEYFYNFSEEDYEDMPEELVKKLEAYQDLYNSKKSKYEELAQNWTETLDEYYYYKTTMMPRLYDIKRWEKTKGYNVGDACYVRTLPSWCHLECVEAGKAGTKEPVLPYPTDGEIIEDNTVKWKVCKNILSLPTAQQSLDNIVEYFASNPIYFLNEIPTLKVVDNEVENMAGLQINNLFRIEIIDDENHKITDESPTPELGAYDPILSESTVHTPWDSRTDVYFVWTGTWHYFKDPSRWIYAKDEWILSNDRWYYADTNGNIVFDCFVDGYRIDENGVCDFTKAVKNDDNTIDYLLIWRDREHDNFIVQSGKWVYEGDDGTGDYIPFLHPWMNTYTYNIAGHKWYYINRYNEIGHSSIFVGKTLEYNYRFYGFNEDYSWDGKTPTNYEASRWQGNIRVYNTGNPDDEAKTTTPLSVYITVTKYMQQYTDYMTDKVQKRLDKKDITFTKIFDIPYDEAMVSGKYDPTKDTVFKDALKEYGLDSLSNFYKSYDGCMDVLRNNGVTDEKSSFMPFNLYNPLYTPYYGRQQLIKEEMAIREATVNALKAEYEGYRAEMDKINEELNLEKYLGKDLINIFWAYTREDTYQNQNYVSTELSEREISDRTQELIKKAQEELQKACKLQITLQDSVKNLLNTEEFKNYKDKFNIGDYIVVEVDDEWYRLRLITASFSYSSPDNISFTFSNATRLTNYFADAQSVIDSAKTISGSYNAVVHQVEQSATVTEEVTDWVDNGLSSALANIMNNDNEEIIIDENGLTAREWNETTKAYNDEQFRITHNSIQFTDDAWKTSALGIGKNTYSWYNSDPNYGDGIGWVTSEGYGVNAKFVTAGYINGTQIIGGDIYSDNYTVADPSHGIAADGSYIDLRNGNFTLGGGGLVGTRNSDGSYTLNYGGNIHVDVGSHLGTWTVYADGFYSGSSVLKPDNIFVTGNVRASDFIVGTGSGSYNLSTKLADLTTNKQDVLTAGTNITIEKVGDDTVISSTGGSGGLEYWTETTNRFYREGTHEGVSGLANYLKPSNNEIGYWERGNGWTQAIVIRLTGNTRKVIMGYTTSAGNHHPHICFASQDELDFEWAWADGTLHPPYGITSWNNKATYPVTAGDYHYVYATGTATYQGESWNVLLVDCVYWDGGDDIDSTEGITMFSQGAWGHKPSAGEVGLALLTTAQAKPYVDTVTEIGTENYTYKHSSSDKTYSSIDTDGNAVFKEVTTDKGSLTSQLNAKQNNLTAGVNININGDTISATDTTYSDFAGLSHGLVPANSDSEQKFLRNDGVWAMVTGGGKAWGGYNIPTSDIGSDGDYYYQFNQNDEVAITYVKINGTWYKIEGGDAGGGEYCSSYGQFNLDGIGNNVGLEAYVS